MEKQKIKIALAMIVKGSDEESVRLAECLKYAAPQVDGIFITITQPNEKVEQVAKSWGAVVSHFKWINDFSAARNFNFSQVPKDYDYIIWLDADDGLRIKNDGKEYRKTGNLKTLKDLIDGKFDVYSVEYLYAFDEFKRPIVTHWKSRIVRNDECVFWRAPLHEDFQETRSLAATFLKGVEVVHLTDNERIEEHRQRNLEIAKQQLEEFPNDPRCYWNMGTSLGAMDKYEEAIGWYSKHIAESGSEDEVYVSRIWRGEAYWKIGRKKDAIVDLQTAIGMRPNLPNAYFVLATFFDELKDYWKAKELLSTGLGIIAAWQKSGRPPMQNSILVFNPRDYDFIPLMKLAKVYLSLSRPDCTLDLLKACAKIYPKDEDIKHKIKLTTQLAEKFNEMVKTVKRLGKIKDKNKLKEEIDKLEPSIRSHPYICTLYNNVVFKTHSTGRDIAYYCGPTDFVWTPETAEKEGIGGSEEAVIALTRRWSELGWNVKVYGNPGHIPKSFQGVEWLPYWMWNPKDKTDITILFRGGVGLASYEINSTKIYADLHDTMPEGEFTEARLKNIDRIFVKSQFHRSLYPSIPDEKFCIVPNGIDASQFVQKEARDPLLIINTSSPDRSLTAYCDAVEQIRKELPQVKAQWAYGWEIFDIINGSNPTRMEWKAKIRERMKEVGIEDLGRLPHHEINKLYQRAAIFLYPTEFAEISCISAMKAQAGGAIPVTSDFSALDETVQFGVKLPSDKTTTTWCLPYQFDFSDHDGKRYASTVVTLLEHYREPSEMRKWAREKFDWGKVALTWQEEMLKPK